MAAIGSDLGTTNSLIACFTDDGPALLPNALGERLTLSAVGLGDDGAVLVGKVARHRPGRRRVPCAQADPAIQRG